MKHYLSILLYFFSFSAFSNNFEQYCIESGGEAERLTAVYTTRSGSIKGPQKKFCTFHIDNGFIAVGLSTFSNPLPTIAATLIKKMPRIPSNSNLLKGPYGNPSLNFCKNIGGSSILFSVRGGGFTNALGETDICVFGDGSMISGWSLIYIANGRNGYELVRDKTLAEPLPIDLVTP